MSLAYQLLGLPDWRPLHPKAVVEVWTEPATLELVSSMPDGAEYFENDKFQVTRRRAQDKVFSSGEMIQLGISYADGTATHDWRDFQWIKNQLAGAECEAFELYPAESRLLDPSNYYILWCFPDIRRVKVGHEKRDVVSADRAQAPQRATVSIAEAVVAPREALRA